MLPFAVFAMPGVINATIAKDTGLSEADVDLLLEALWLARAPTGKRPWTAATSLHDACRVRRSFLPIGLP